MQGSGSSFQRTITAAGLALLGLAILVVLFNLITPIPEGSPLRGFWVVLKAFVAAVLLISWVLLNVPQPKPPSGQFVLAIAQFGELQPDGSGWQIVPGQRSTWDQARAVLPANLPLPSHWPALRLRVNGATASANGASPAHAATRAQGA